MDGGSKLEEFGRQHADARQALRAWHNEAENAQWNTTADIKKRYPKASILRSGRVVFNICGNRYRLVVHCERPFVFIRWVGTHAKYDSIDAQTI